MGRDGGEGRKKQWERAGKGRRRQSVSERAASETLYPRRASERAKEEMDCLLISLTQHRTAEHSGGSKLRSGTVTVSGEGREQERDGSRLVVEPRREDGGEDKGVNVMTGDETMRVCESTYG